MFLAAQAFRAFRAFPHRPFLPVVSLIGLVLVPLAPRAQAGTEGSVSGVLTGPQHGAVAGATVELRASGGKILKSTTTSPTGEFQFFPVDFGDYQLTVSSRDLAPYSEEVHVSSGADTHLAVALETKAADKKDEVVVLGQRSLIHATSAASVVEIGKSKIESQPQGESVSLPKLVANNTPGVIQGPFGQMFIRGNHANIQYQIDGVQLPDSPSNTFGDAFAPRNIDHMEVITGGVPAEYGERLAAVVNIITKTGAEEPGGSVGLTYGSFNTVEPNAVLSGSTKDGSFHYYLSATYKQTERGLDTPQPRSDDNLKQGGARYTHDRSTDDVTFAKFDWLPTTADRLSLMLFNSRYFFQIPNYPTNFAASDPIFAATYVDSFGNGPGSYHWSPAATDDNQTERNRYAQMVWRHMFSDATSLQIAPYWKASTIAVNDDQDNDLASATLIPGSAPSSFNEDRTVNNYGLKVDLSTRVNPSNLVKAGVQAQSSKATGAIHVTIPAVAPATGVQTSTDGSPTTANFEAVYLQDDISVTKWLSFNVGLRFDATQVKFADENTKDQLLQPRVGANILLTESTKWHLFYGKLFQPAPAENLRDTFVATNAGQLAPYDIKAEKDDYYETGLSQQIGKQVAALTYYYKKATNMLDDAQLLNTSIAQPYNFKTGYAYGTEFALSGQIDSNWSDFLNYAHEIAKGKGISGGLFAFPAGQAPTDNWTYLDHVQIDTGNAGVTYRKDNFWWSGQVNYGSGLRTGPNNTLSLPSHTTEDTTVGYAFQTQPKLKVSADVLNITDNHYPITVSNGFNGSHYAAGREYYVHLTADF